MDDHLLSSHYHSILDGAIFDGRVRIYYSQFDEDEALRLYFEVQNAKLSDQINKYTKEEGLVFVYLYPEDLQAQNIPDFKELEFIVKNKNSNRYILTQTPLQGKKSQLMKLIKTSLVDLQKADEKAL